MTVAAETVLCETALHPTTTLPMSIDLTLPMSIDLTELGASPSASPDATPEEHEAPPIRFDRQPASLQALALVRHLVGMIDDYERSQGSRQRARSVKAQAELVRTVGSFAGDLVAAVDLGERPPVPCPKDRNAFTNLPVNYRAFRATYETFVARGLITVAANGWWRKSPFGGRGGGRGETERVRPTEAFVSLVRDHGIAHGTAGQHFPRRAKPAPLGLRSGSVWVYGEKLRGQQMAVPRGDLVARQLAAEIRELNDFATGFTLGSRRKSSTSEEVRGANGDGSPVEFSGWTRIFNEGKRDGYGWDRGGRLYAKPENSYQSLSKEERLRLTIDGKPVVEIDICASHLSLVYALRGISPGERFRRLAADGRTWSAIDPYAIGDLPRPVVKAWITATLGAGKPPKRWPKDAAKDLRESEGIDTRAYSVAAVQAAVLQEHSVLADLEGISWATLQFLESRAIVGAMLRLKREHGIPALPVHDSLIVPRAAGEVAKGVLVDELRAVTGHEPIPPKIASG